jgi:Berberine and berberine like
MASSRCAKDCILIARPSRRVSRDADNVAWVRSAFQSFEPFGTGSVYLNFTGRADEAPSAGVDSAYGRNLQRLAELKHAYDPHNFFNLNNNITPLARE